MSETRSPDVERALPSGPGQRVWRRRRDRRGWWVGPTDWLATHNLVLVLLAAPLLTFPGRWTPFGAILIVVGLLARWLVRGRPTPPTVLDRPLALLGVMAGVAYVVSAMPEASASKLWGIVLGLALYYALVDVLARSQSYSRALGGLILTGVGIAAVALVGTDWTSAPIVDVAGLRAVYPLLPTLVRGIPGSGIPRDTDLFNPREIGGILALLLPLAMVPLLCLRVSGPMRLLPLAAAAIVMGFVLVLTQAPSAIAGVALASWLSVAGADPARRPGWIVAGMAGAAGALVWVWVHGTGLTQPGPWEISRSAGKPGVEHAAFGFASRLEIWPRAIQMVHDTPYTGVGLNTFPWVMDRFYPGFALGPEPHAHNFLLQTAVDFGLPGLVALLWLGAAVALTLVDAYRAAPDARIRVATLAVSAGLLAFLLYGAMDAVTLGAKPGLALWGSLALAVALGKAAPGADRPGTSWQKPLTVGSLVLLGAAFLLPLAWSGPAENAGRILAYRALLASPDSARPGASGDTALPALENAVQSDPTNAGNWYLLGVLRADAGRADDALSALRQAVMIDRRAPLWIYALGEALAGNSSGDRWSDLARVYDQWNRRYPRRAEWYVTTAIVDCEGQGNLQRALAALNRGTAEQAQPENLIGVYRNVIASPRAPLRSASPSWPRGC